MKHIFSAIWLIAILLYYLPYFPIHAAEPDFCHIGKFYTEIFAGASALVIKSRIGPYKV